jgi:hypothetical protein
MEGNRRELNQMAEVRTEGSRVVVDATAPLSIENALRLARDIEQAARKAMASEFCSIPGTIYRDANVEHCLYVVSRNRFGFDTPVLWRIPIDASQLATYATREQWEASGVDFVRVAAATGVLSHEGRIVAED